MGVFQYVSVTSFQPITCIVIISVWQKFCDHNSKRVEKGGERESGKFMFSDNISCLRFYSVCAD